jgi:hypothetical protein
MTLTSLNSTTITFTWNATGLTKGNYAVSAYVTPVLGEIDTTDNNYTGGSVVVTKAGDLGGYAPGLLAPQFGYCDGSCGPDDIPLFIMCYRGTAPPQWEYLGDLGSLVNGVPTFFKCDGVCNAVDVALFIRCYRGQGP